MLPPKLKKGSGIRIVAPSCSLRSMPWVTDEFLTKAKKFFEDRGMTVTEGKHIREMDELESSSITSRIEDLHDAFSDPFVHMIITIRGGFRGNQLLKYLDYDLIKKHPKIFCGFSDITVLQNAIYAKTGLATYSGPNFSQFGFSEQIPYTISAFEKCVMQDAPFAVEPSPKWTDERYSLDHPNLASEKNEGWWILQEGSAEGTLLGGNLCTLNLLQGTEFMPDMRGSILFLEDDYESPGRTFDRDLQSLLHLPAAKEICGLGIGRFQKKSAITRPLLEKIIREKQELRGIPIIANVDFGHTQPMITFPIGGTIQMEARAGLATLTINDH